ncbi:MAG: aminotransferase class I/II-fold pyridoxal phosphate-dependent enzyme, partial [Omnitrophica bacterium]|nr:aminotransferase class I/II-fold pyridoxal phosphate-dependent enzyme [Candidatus Omnitrophota bacterium]
MLNSLHGGDIWKHLKDARAKLIDFSANVNPLGSPACVVKTIHAKIKTLIYYPEPNAQSLQKKLVQCHKITQQNIALGNGSIELIYLIPRALAVKNVLIVVPTFSEYEFASRACGLNPIFFSLSAKEKFAVDLTVLINLLPNADLLFICNPNNPTGRLWTKRELSVLLAACKKHNTVLVIDEAFIDFSQDTGGCSLIDKVKTTDNLIVIRSLTK